MKTNTSSILIISSDSHFNTSIANECYQNNIDVIFNSTSLELYKNIKNIFNYLIIIDFHTKNFNKVIKELSSEIRLGNAIVVFDNNEYIQIYRKSNAKISELLFKKNIIIKKIKNIFTQFNVSKD